VTVFGNGAWASSPVITRMEVRSPIAPSCRSAQPRRSTDILHAGWFDAECNSTLYSVPFLVTNTTVLQPSQSKPDSLTAQFQAQCSSSPCRWWLSQALARNRLVSERRRNRHEQCLHDRWTTQRSAQRLYNLRQPVTKFYRAIHYQARAALTV